VSDAYLNTQDNVYQAMQAPDVDPMVAAKDVEEEFRKIGRWLTDLDATDISRWNHPNGGEINFTVGETRFTVQKNEWIVYNDSKGKFVILDQHQFEVLFG
jgi:hypothetical protein